MQILCDAAAAATPTALRFAFNNSIWALSGLNEHSLYARDVLIYGIRMMRFYDAIEAIEIFAHRTMFNCSSSDSNYLHQFFICRKPTEQYTSACKIKTVIVMHDNYNDVIVRENALFDVTSAQKRRCGPSCIGSNVIISCDWILSLIAATKLTAVWLECAMIAHGCYQMNDVQQCRMLYK